METPKAARLRLRVRCLSLRVSASADFPVSQVWISSTRRWSLRQRAVDIKMEGRVAGAPGQCLPLLGVSDNCTDLAFLHTGGEAKR